MIDFNGRIDGESLSMLYLGQIIIFLFLALSQVFAQEPFARGRITAAPLEANTLAPAPMDTIATEAATTMAAPSSAETKPETKLPPVFEGKDDFISLNAAMAAAHFEIRPSLQNRSDLVYALSKLVAYRCMSSLHRTLVYSSSPQDKDCQDAISYTLSIDPSNPEAICAKDGIDSPSCRNAFREQETLTHIPFKVDLSLIRKFESDVRIKESEQAAVISKAKDQLLAATSSEQN